jgi:tetratricopeptide (TPR) repeat protein
MRIAALLSIFFCVGTAADAGLATDATTASNLRNAEFLREIAPPFRQLYGLDFDQAEKAFAALKQRFPEHPGPPLYIAGVLLQRELFSRQDLTLERFLSPGYFSEPTRRRMPQAERDRFFGSIAESQRLANAILKSRPGDLDARYFLGASDALLGSFAFTIDHNRTQAFRHGKSAYRYHLGLIQERADYYDAYMTVGMYEYIVASIPWYLKWIAAVAGYHGSKQRGFEFLELAVAKSTFVNDDSRVLLMLLDVREKRYAQALEHATQLHRSFPRNFLLELNRAQILEAMGKRGEADVVFDDVLRKAAARVPNYDRIPRPFLDQLERRAGHGPAAQ